MFTLNLHASMHPPSMVSKLCCGLATSDPRIDPLVLSVGLMGLSGIVTCLFPLYSGRPSRVDTHTHTHTHTHAYVSTHTFTLSFHAVIRFSVRLIVKNINFEKLKRMLSLAEQRICIYCSFCKPVRSVVSKENFVLKSVCLRSMEYKRGNRVGLKRSESVWPSGQALGW